MRMTFLNKKSRSKANFAKHGPPQKVAKQDFVGKARSSRMSSAVIFCKKIAASECRLRRAGALSGTRTLGPLIKSQLLYQLS